MNLKKNFLGQLKKLKSGLQANLSHSVNVEPLHEMEGLTVSEVVYSFTSKDQRVVSDLKNLPEIRYKGEVGSC